VFGWLAGWPHGGRAAGPVSDLAGGARRLCGRPARLDPKAPAANHPQAEASLAW
jgi:hypothetical protein